LIDIKVFALDTFDKKRKNIFQPADPEIFPETPQVPALNGAHFRDCLNLITQLLILRS
jgi:hypothetical protein